MQKEPQSIYEDITCSCITYSSNIKQLNKAPPASMCKIL